MPWIRIVDPESELRTLLIRERVSTDQLSTQQIRCPLKREHAAQINFTPVSAFHFFTDGVKQDFFEGSEDKFGIVVDRKEGNGRNVIFRASQRCEVSDDIFKTSMNQKDFALSLENRRFGEINEQQVENYVKNIFQNNLEECEEDSQLSASDASIPWTEGLFRHKFSDIGGILVHDNKNSLRQGYAFAKTLEKVNGKRTNFYFWDKEKSELFEVDRGLIKRTLGFEISDSGCYKVDPETLSVMKEFQSYLTAGTQRG